jgi:homeobox protein cut-like
VLSEKQDNWVAKEKSLEEKIENQDRLLKEVKASYEVSQRLSKGEDDAEADNARQGASAAELEIVSSELDRANMRLAEVEARNEQFRLELAQSASNTKASVSVEDDPTFLRLQSENSSLIRKLENSKFEKDSEKRKWDGDLRSLEREIATLKKDRDVLRERVQNWGDYENVKRELEVLKVSFSILPVYMSTADRYSRSSSRQVTTMKKSLKASPPTRTDQPTRAKPWNNFYSRGTRNSATN